MAHAQFQSRGKMYSFFSAFRHCYGAPARAGAPKMVVFPMSYARRGELVLPTRPKMLENTSIFNLLE